MLISIGALAGSIELLSPTTEKVDRGEKMRIYSKALHVSEYYLYDPETEVFEGYALDLATLTYAPMVKEPNGDYASARMGLRLGVRPGRYQGDEGRWLRWIDSDGRVLPTGEEKGREAVAKAAHAEQKASQAEQKASQAEQKASQAEQKASQAEQTAREMAARLAEYEKRFGKLDGPQGS